MGNFCMRLGNRVTRSIDEPLRPAEWSTNTPPTGGRAHSPSESLPESTEEKNFKVGITKFNVKPSEGIKYLVELGMLDPSPESVAKFLHSKRLFRGRTELTSGLSKRQIGLYLGALGRDDKQVAFHRGLLRAYTSQCNFSGKSLDSALRAYLELFRLPGESQSIDRIMEEFAKHYDSQNPKIFDSGPDCVHVLSFATIILNTDAHNPNVKKKNKMKKEQFVKMNRGIDGGKDVPRDLLESIYGSIVKKQIQTGWETGVVTFFNPTCEGWLHKRGAGFKGGKKWTRRYFLLNEHCLYYFNTQPGTEESKGKENCRCIIPLENCQVVENLQGTLTFALRSNNPFGKQVKSAKRMKNGSIVQGKHSEYIFKAESEKEKSAWVKALKNEVTDNPLLDTLAERRAKARGVRRRTRRTVWGLSPHPRPDDEIASPSSIFVEQEEAGNSLLPSSKLNLVYTPTANDSRNGEDDRATVPSVRPTGSQSFEENRDNLVENLASK